MRDTVGNWGNGIWQDDDADEVVIMFHELLEAGATASEAVQRIIVDPPGSWEDLDERVVQVLALAALALQHAVLTPELRDWAIATIASGAPLGRWDWDGVQPEKVAARKELLQRFKEMLLRGTATPEELESVATPEAFSLW